MESLRLWAHDRAPGIPRNVNDLETIEFSDVLGAIAEDQHLTRCAQGCFAGTEEDQAEHSWETKTWKKMPWKKLIEKLIYLNKCLYPVTDTRERTSSVLASSPSPSSRRNQTVTSKSATRTERSTRADVTCCPSSTRLYQCCKDISMSGLRKHKAKTSNTQSITTSTLHIQSRCGSRCVRDRGLSRRTLFDLECCLYGNHLRSSMDCERIREPRFPVVTFMFTCFRTWLDALGRLA